MIRIINVLLTLLGVGVLVTSSKILLNIKQVPISQRTFATSFVFGLYCLAFFTILDANNMLYQIKYLIINYSGKIFVVWVILGFIIGIVKGTREVRRNYLFFVFIFFIWSIVLYFIVIYIL